MGILYFLDLTGVAVFAVSGALAGIRMGLDLFGVTVLAAVTAVGGGTVRDLLLNRHPISWIADSTYIYVILATTLVVVLGAHFLPDVHLALLIADAMGLGLFAISGAEAVEAQGHPWIVIVLAGTLGGVAGGVIRDVLSGIVPLVLRRDIYATAAIIGIVLYLLMKKMRIPSSWASVTAMMAIVLVRLCAIAYNWQLPMLAVPPS